MVKLTAKAVENARAKGARREISDDLIPALRLVVNTTGSKSWAVRARVAGKPVKLTLGSAEAFSLSKARAWAREQLLMVKSGTDPRAVKRQRIEADREAKAELTLEGVVEKYLEHRAEPRLAAKTIVEVRRALLKTWKPLHRLPIGKVTRARIAAELLRIKSEHGGTTSNRCRSYLSGCLSWAVKQGLVELNPVSGTEAAAPETEKERVLSLEELRVVWQAAVPDTMYGRIVRLLTVLGARRQEIGGMIWAELSPNLATWTLPASRSKTKRARVLPLPPAAIEIIRNIPRMLGQDHLFGRNGFQAWSQSFDRLAAKAVLAEPWTPHDLRRSFITHLHEHAVCPPHIVDEIVGHVGKHRQGARGAYNRALYLDAKAAALVAWQRLLLDDEAGVVELRRQA